MIRLLAGYDPVAFGLADFDKVLACEFDGGLNGFRSSGYQINPVKRARCFLDQEFGKGFSSKEQRVGPLAPGKYKITTITEDGRSVTKPITLKGQAERRVKLRLK